MNDDSLYAIANRLSGIEEQLARIANALETASKPPVTIVKMRIRASEVGDRRLVQVATATFVMARASKEVAGQPGLYFHPDRSDHAVMSLDDPRLWLELSVRAADAPSEPGLYRVKCRPVRGDIDLWDFHEWEKIE